MASKVTIANIALIELGGDQITSFTQDTDNAARVNVLYPEAVKTVLSRGSWSFATFRAELAALTAAPEWEFTHQFQLPTSPKSLKLLKINGNDAQKVDYKVEQDRLLINSSSVKIKFIGEVTDSGSFNEYFKTALVAFLKYQLTYPLTSDVIAVEKALAMYENVLATSLSLDGQQSNGNRVGTNDLILVRGDSPDIQG